MGRKWAFARATRQHHRQQIVPIRRHSKGTPPMSSFTRIFGLAVAVALGLTGEALAHPEERHIGFSHG
jgi:hypothetical protein